MSFVMRGAGVGEGDGVGVGVAVCASAFSGALETASPAAPAAGRSLTKVRRSNALVSLGFLCPGFFITVLKMISVGSIYHHAPTELTENAVRCSPLTPPTAQGTIVPLPTAGALGVPYFIFTSFALPVR